LNTTWGSFETFWIPDEYQLSNVWRRIRDFAALLRSGIARKIDYGPGLLGCHAVKYKGGRPQCPQNGRFLAFGIGRSTFYKHAFVAIKQQCIFAINDNK